MSSSRTDIATQSVRLFVAKEFFPKRKRLNEGTVPPFKMHPGGTDPPFKMHPGGTVPPFKMHPRGTLDSYDSFFLS